MGRDFIDGLLDALNRVVELDSESLREVLIISGMPEKDENLRYLGFNRQKIRGVSQDLQFSAVAVINNRRIDKWQLTGFRKKLSRLVFSPRWTRNPMDLFINHLRCDPRLMRILASSKEDYTLFGILMVQSIQSPGLDPCAQPIIAVPGINDGDLDMISAFETANKINRFSWMHTI